ncbi:ubiquitin-conjugating enzyme E2-binding protein [Tirmania nivea]|nr:ubiquitin-conjugating enzyme E2-binding protein [Tirmania nivea]
MEKTSPLLYSELLRNLQQVNVFIDLPTPATSTTCLSLDKRGSSLSLHHESTAQKWDISLPLPSIVRPQLPAPTSPNQLQLSISPGATTWSKSLSLLRGDTATRQEDDNHVPWAAPELNSLHPTFNCVHCRAEVLCGGKVKTWKDLPCHNWAEVMDFWHCHKPHEKGDTDKDKAVKRRLARNTSSGKGIGGFVAPEGVGLVDLTFFLVNRRDVRGNFDTSTENGVSRRKRTIHCAGCRTSLGFGEDISDDENSGTPLPCTTASSSVQIPPMESYPPLPFLSAQLITMISDLALRRFRLTSEPQTPNPKIELWIWIFNTDRIYSYASAEKVVEPSRGMKIYYSENGPPVGESPGNGVTTGVAEEDIVVPRDLLEEARAALRKSTEEIPKMIREFRGWKAGNLERFGRDVKAK